MRSAVWPIVGVTTGLMLLSGCASIGRTALPPEVIAHSNRTAFPGLRFPAEEASASVAATNNQSDRPYSVLALSGGGPDGAYGAGLLVGWSASGQRPAFDVVTGVSTGALMSPFAFLGSAYDEKLRAIYTGPHIQTILAKGSVVRLIGGPAIYRSAGLRALIDANVDDALLSAIAAEHRNGRRLYVATANLDAQQMDVWDMGAIAALGTSHSKLLFREVLLSAASVPVAFSPVLIETTAGNAALTEAHADATVFSHFYMGAQLFPSDCRSGPRRCASYIIVHNKTVAEPATLAFKAPAVIKRALETVIKANLNTRLLATAQMTRENNIAFRLAYLDVPFPGVSPVNFDLDYMRKIYTLGETAGRRPETWLDRPPKDK
jgi:Patatin-like phospholipase